LFDPLSLVQYSFKVIQQKYCTFTESAYRVISPCQFPTYKTGILIVTMTLIVWENNETTKNI